MNMPLSSTYNPKLYEQRIVNIWKEGLLGKYERQMEVQNITFASNPQSYSIVVPPPNLTGVLHAGHAFEHFLMDSLVRISRLKGKPTLYQPGVDHAGIQLEGVINKLINQGEFDNLILQKYPDILNLPTDQRANHIKQNHTDFYLELAWSKVNPWRDEQLKQAEILGDSPDFSRLLFTLDPRAKDMAVHAFQKYWQDGIVYRDKYLINWSVALQTALSDVPEDIGHEERVDPMVTFEYRLQTVDTKALDGEVDVELKDILHNALKVLKVSTVRPETIFADVALAIHPKILKKKLLEQRLNDLTVAYIIDLIRKGKVNITYQIEPLLVRNVKLLVEETVEADFGTGILKITPAHDLHDYEIAKKHNLTTFVQSIDRSGKLSEVAGKFAGQEVLVARLNVIQKLLDEGYIPYTPSINNDANQLTAILDQEYIEVAPISPNKEQESLSYEQRCKQMSRLYADYEIDWEYKHNVVICERSKTIVEPLISEEFFVDYYTKFEHNPIRFFDNLDCSSIEINSDRLVMRSITPECAWHLHDNMTSIDAELVISPDFKKIEDAQKWVTERIEENKTGDRLTLCIFDKNYQFLGYSGIRKEDSQYKLTIWIIDKYKQQGFATECIKSLCNWSFANLPANRLIYEVKTQNLASIKVAEKCGFVMKQEKTFNSSTNPGQKYYIYELDRPKVSLQSLAMNGLEQVNFYPVEYKQRGLDYFAKIKNWCISRDLVWGIRIPIWYNLDLNPDKVFYSGTETNKLVVVGGKEYKVWDLFRVQADKPDSIGNWVQEQKILDTWFSSTLWPLSTLGFNEFAKALGGDFVSRSPMLIPRVDLDTLKKPALDFARFYPTQTMTTAWEIFYAWIIRMVMTGMYFTGQPPFENYCCHAWVLDEKGRKMSKSLGNVFDPGDQIAKYSADATRMAMLSGCIPGKNLRFQGKLADNLCEKYRNFGNKLWNTARFLDTKIRDVSSLNANPKISDKNYDSQKDIIKSKPYSPKEGDSKNSIQNIPLRKLKPIRIDFDFKRIAFVIRQNTVPALTSSQGKVKKTANEPMIIPDQRLSLPVNRSIEQGEKNTHQNSSEPNLPSSVPDSETVAPISSILASIQNSELKPASAWILQRLQKLEEQIEKSYKNYNFAEAIDQIYRFLLDNLAPWYIEYLKTDTANLAFAYELLKRYVMLISPFIPFESQALWEDFFEESGILAQQILSDDFYQKYPISVQENESTEFESIIDCIENIRSLKGLFSIDPAQSVSIYTDSELLIKYANYIKLLTKAIVVSDTGDHRIYKISGNNYTFGIDIFAYVQDRDKELQKTNKQIESIQKQILALESQLSNKTFIEKADESVILDKQSDLAARKSDLEKQESKKVLLQSY